MCICKEFEDQHTIHKHPNWVITYHDDGYDEFPYVKNRLYVAHISERKIKSWEFDYPEALNLNLQTLINKLEEHGNYSDEEYENVYDCVKQFIKDVQERYPELKRKL